MKNGLMVLQTFWRLCGPPSWNDDEAVQRRALVECWIGHSKREKLSARVSFFPLVSYKILGSESKSGGGPWLLITFVAAW